MTTTVPASTLATIGPSKPPAWIHQVTFSPAYLVRTVTVARAANVNRTGRYLFSIGAAQSALAVWRAVAASLAGTAVGPLEVVASGRVPGCPDGCGVEVPVVPGVELGEPASADVASPSFPGDSMRTTIRVPSRTTFRSITPLVFRASTKALFTCSMLIEKGQIPGKVTEDEGVVLVDLGPDHLELIAGKKSASFWLWQEPVVLFRPGQPQRSARSSIDARDCGRDRLRNLFLREVSSGRASELCFGEQALHAAESPPEHWVAISPNDRGRPRNEVATAAVRSVPAMDGCSCESGTIRPTAGSRQSA